MAIPGEFSNLTNAELTERFDKVYPCGHSNMRTSLQVTQHKPFIVKAEGSHMWDVEGNEYIDFLLAYGPNIHGFCNPEIVQAMKDYLDDRPIAIGSGSFFTPEDVELGEKIVRHVPCAEEVKLNLGGTDAVQTAIRLARAYTGRPRFIRFNDQYHGWCDNTMGGRYDNEAEGRPFAIQGMLDDYRYSEGKVAAANEESFMLPYNEIGILEDTLKQYGEEVAMIHCEPYVVNHGCQMPRPGYLERVRELCDEYGIVMSFDEIITGFRVAIGGAQERFGVTPDIATFGKALGGGMPLSAVAGKSEIMGLMRENRVLSPGTFNAFPLSICAALASLKILERDNCAVYKEVGRKTQRMMDGLREIAKRRDLPIRFQGEPGVFMMLFGVDPDEVYYSDEETTLDRTMGIVFWSKMTERGIVIMPDGRWFVSAAITEEDIDRALEASDEALGEMV